MITQIEENFIRSTWMTFERTQERSEKKRTEKWNVISRKGVVLGELRWYGQWRQYAFAPLDVAPLFNQSCLRDIRDVLRILNREQVKYREISRV